jgi:hypothetical protein
MLALLPDSKQGTHGRCVALRQPTTSNWGGLAATAVGAAATAAAVKAALSDS